MRETIYVYEFAYTHKVTGEDLRVEVEHLDYESAKAEALEQVFTIAEDCEVSLVYTNEPKEREETWNDKPVQGWEL